MTDLLLIQNKQELYNCHPALHVISIYCFNVHILLLFLHVQD